MTTDPTPEMNTGRLFPGMDEQLRQADPQTTEPACKFDEGCHRVVACDPGCAVAAAELYRRMAPPAVRPELRDQIAEARCVCGEPETPGIVHRSDGPCCQVDNQVRVIALALARVDAHEWADGMPLEDKPLWQTYLRRADAVLSVLPATTNRAAVLREEAARIRAHCPDHLDSESAEGSWMACHCAVADDMERRMAVEAQQQTETEAHPAEHTWAAELHDPLADEWVPGTRYPVRERAVNALEHAKTIGPTWKDGAPTQRRLVRMTTTYTVEQPAVVAAVAGEARASRSDVGTEFVHQVDHPDKAALDLWETDLAQSGVDTPGCDCGHDGMGVRWHDTACAWKGGLVAEARAAVSQPGKEA